MSVRVAFWCLERVRGETRCERGDVVMVKVGVAQSK